MCFLRIKLILQYYFLICIFVFELLAFAELPPKITGIYLPPHNFTKRRLSEFIHYSKYTKMNAVVLHVKAPRGLLYWRSKNTIAREIGAVTSEQSIEETLQYLKANNIWSIAKVDVFIDSKLALNRPDYGVKNSKTGEIWTDFSGLHWANPYDSRVWDYNIELSRELAAAGFDEIQFDYVRFPSDGNLKLLKYPDKPVGLAMSKCISRFLEKAYVNLNPMGVYVSVDVFGLTAWKKTDFGVGQILEDISPFVDIICPMFYPSHFPRGFLGFDKPANYPKQIMYQSTRMMMNRTDKKIRPWVQGFWYPPEKIALQLDAVQKAGVSDWMVWSSSGIYEKTHLALIKNLADVFPPPVFYPSLIELKKRKEKTIRGSTSIVNYTNYQKEYSIISLEKSDKNNQGKYSTPISVIYSMDEAILDLLLEKNKSVVNRKSDKYTKSILIADILCRQINRDPHHISPQPIFVDWGKTGTFQLSLPPEINDIMPLSSHQ